MCRCSNENQSDVSESVNDCFGKCPAYYLLIIYLYVIIRVNLLDFHKEDSAI